jgi:hypothetical protein
MVDNMEVAKKYEGNQYRNTSSLITEVELEKIWEHFLTIEMACSLTCRIKMNYG